MLVMPKTAKPNKNQRQRFIEAAREAGASEDEAVFDENLKRIAKPREKPDANRQKT
jgi:hypothetical protein